MERSLFFTGYRFQIPSQMATKFYTQANTKVFMDKKHPFWYLKFGGKDGEMFEQWIAGESLDASILAAVYKLAGSYQLSRDNPVIGEKFLTKSLAYYSEIEPKSLNSRNTMNELISEAKVYYARCLVRNYENLQEGELILKQQMDYNIKGDTLQKRINFVNACLGVDEMKCWQISAYWEEIGLTPLHNDVFSSWVIEISKVKTCSTILAEYKAIAIAVNDYARKFPWKRYKSNFVQLPCKLFDKGFVRACFRHEYLSTETVDMFFNWTLPKDYLGMAYWCYWFVTNKVNSSKERLELSFDCYDFRRENVFNYLGEEHIETIKALFLKGEMILDNRKTSEPLKEEGLEFISTALHKMKKHNLGKYDSYCTSLTKAAQLYVRAGCFEKAADFYKLAIATRKSYSGTKINYEVVKEIKCLGHLYMTFKEYNLAIECFNEAVTCMESETGGRWHHNIARCYNWLGICHMEQRNFDIAKISFDKKDRNLSRSVNKIQETELFWNSLVATKFTFLTQKSTEEAKGMFKKAEKLYITLGGEKQQFSMELPIMFGELYEFLENNLKKARKFYRLVLDANDVYFEKHPFLCECLLGLARVSFKKKKIEECEAYAFRASQMATQLFNHNNVVMDSLITLFGDLLKRRKTLSKAHSVFIDYCKRFPKQGVSEKSPFVATLALNFGKELLFSGFNLTICAEMLQTSLKVS